MGVIEGKNKAREMKMKVWGRRAVKVGLVLQVRVEKKMEKFK